MYIRIYGGRGGREREIESTRARERERERKRAPEREREREKERERERASERETEREIQRQKEGETACWGPVCALILSSCRNTTHTVETIEISHDAASIVFILNVSDIRTPQLSNRPNSSASKTRIPKLLK